MAIHKKVVLSQQGRLPEAAADFERYRELVGKLEPEEEQLWRELKGQLKQKWPQHTQIERKGIMQCRFTKMSES